jgi:hypothetical protein
LFIRNRARGRNPRLELDARTGLNEIILKMKLLEATS